ncbi:hypothetical protein D6D12_09259 [Aureobasidium pullulans]|uniref:Cora-domain-containing protein n=1 Tax=Aureobasidium pullulans TaxID=5580 RepID=A0AB74JHZ2_AURPU|nr:hypothetical protein D6D12_09259 [Aureobasidium pullulans]THX32892.1 hypothetical protein D6D11_09805 [Aureobasidium pullulans]
MSTTHNQAGPKSSNPNIEALLYEPSNRTWKIVGIPLLDLLRVTRSPEIPISKLTTSRTIKYRHHFLNDPVLRQELCKHFPNIPRMFWSKTCVQHNGFFGAKTSIAPSTSGAASPNSASALSVQTWFRMIVKSIKPTPKNIDFTQYQWYEMSFVSAFSEDRNLLLCLDTPRSLVYTLLDIVSEEENKDIITGPYGFHQVLFEQLMVLYDESVWDIAFIMRNNEKSKGPMGNTDLHYFIKLYEDSRHTVHSIEATQEATKVFECIASQCASLACQHTTHRELLSARSEMFKFQHSMMQGFLARAVSNDRRMGNEQNLTSNLMSQLDAKTNVDIAMATKDDGVAMKTIAIVTMTFLPATFVSALLGMNFFAYDPDAHGGHITYSHDLWMYFVISIVLTLILFAIWWVWQQYRKKWMASSRLEDANAMEHAFSVLQKP